MERYRYTGPLESVDVPISGAVIQFERMKWVNPETQATEANVPVEHLAIALGGLGDDFEREGPKKAAATRRKNAAADAADDDPAEPEQETDQ